MNNTRCSHGSQISSLIREARGLQGSTDAAARAEFLARKRALLDELEAADAQPVGEGRSDHCDVSTSTFRR